MGKNGLWIFKWVGLIEEWEKWFIENKIKLQLFMN